MGDILLVRGHGFVMLEDSEIIEVKQGPYSENGIKRNLKGKIKYI